FILCVLALSAGILHPFVAYLILFKSKNMNAYLRLGYVALQIIQVLQDIVFCLFIQAYPLTPLPLLGCNGILCDMEWFPPVKLPEV
ncbi:hypothetical protein PENTCL1PPCAC_14900, partial [Pristionchus entomophagus]